MVSLRHKALLFLLLSSVVGAADFEVETELAPRTAPFGTTLKLTVDLSWKDPAQYTPVKPETLEFEDFEVRDAVFTPLPEQGGRQRGRYTFRLARYEPGEATVPSVGFTYQQGGADVTTWSEEVSVKLTGAKRLDSDKEGVIRDLKAFEPLPLPLWVYLLGLLLGAALVALVWKTLAWLLRPRPKASPPPVSSHLKALARLKELEEERLFEQDRGQEFADRLSAILRSYLAERYRLPVLERTTSELVSILKEAAFTDGLRREVRSILGLADLVKFARREPTFEEGQASLAQTRALVETTAPKEEDERDSG